MRFTPLEELEAEADDASPAGSMIWDYRGPVSTVQGQSLIMSRPSGNLSGGCVVEVMGHSQTGLAATYQPVALEFLQEASLDQLPHATGSGLRLRTQLLRFVGRRHGSGLSGRGLWRPLL